MMKSFSFKGRIRLVFGIFILFALLMAVRLYFLQIVNGDKYSETADRQYVNISVNTYDRGSIFFKDKNGDLVSAAGLDSGYTVALNIRNMATDTDYYKELSDIIPLDSASFYSEISNGSSYVEIAHRVTEDQIKKVDDLNLAGLVVSNEKWRYYPGGSMASQLIGFVGYDDSGQNLVGRYGLEKYYDNVLERDNGSLYMNTFAQIFSNLSQNFMQNDNREGDVVTGIDPELQVYVDKIVSDTNKQWSSDVTGAIVMDPTTGQIYAMSVYPNFDLNNFQNAANVGVYLNPLVSSAYEMGSIIKPLTLAAALDSGAVTATSTYNDTASITVDGSTIHNYDDRGLGKNTPMQMILNDSRNVGASYLATIMGKPTMLKYFEGYGIGSETGIDLPNEAAGNIFNLTSNLKNSKLVEYDTASFGQGISMTPIMTARALSVLANGGKLVIPHIASQIDYKIGLPKTIDYSDEAIQVLKPSTSDEITQMLINVVDQALANGTLALQHYSIAAKTGTAQIARPASEGGGYYPNQYLHSFFGYFPAYNPKFLVFLYTLRPKNVDYASQTLTNPFFDITKFLINYYQIPPDR